MFHIPSILFEFEQLDKDPTLSTVTLQIDDGTVPVSRVFPPKFMFVRPFKLSYVVGIMPRITLSERS